MSSPTWGGKRDGAGRPRRWLHLQPPDAVLVQLLEIALAEDCTVEDVVREAILSYVADWQAEHDAEGNTLASGR
jgi:hypothetical protein